MLSKFLTTAAVAVCFAIALGTAFWMFLDRREAPAIVIEDPRPNSTIVVSIEGAVATPGVYSLPGDARVQHAVEAAGGFSQNADLAQVNQAKRLRDEERLIIPSLSATTGAASLMAGTVAPSSAAAPAKVNINTASIDELISLPDIGQTLAERIVDYRNEHGPFKIVEELAQVEGVSLKMVDDLRSLITV